MIAATEAQRLPDRFPASVLDHGGAKEYLKTASATASPEWFGLNNDRGHTELGFFVGIGRLPISGSPVLNVRPRFAHLDYAAMYARCAADSVVSGHLDRTFTVWPERDPVPIEQAQHDWFARLLVYASLNATAKLCARHLRRGSMCVVENLQGRVKGRVLVGEQIRQNLSRMRPDRTLCSFARFEVGILENVILRAALEVGASFLGRSPMPVDRAVLPAIAAARAALSGVAVRRIHARDHLSARTTGVMAAYRTPLRLARAVLDHLGLDPENLHASSEPRDVPPFALCTYELFESYCEVLLRESHRDVEALVRREDNLGQSFKVRPDYLVHCEGQGWIVDAKYKPCWHWAKDGYHADVYQVVGYSRHRAVLEKLKALRMQENSPRIAVLFPASKGERAWDGKQRLCDFAVPKDRLDDFEVPLIRVPVFIPSRGC